MSLLVISEIVELFDTLTVDDDYSLPKSKNLTQLFQLQLSKKL